MKKSLFTGILVLSLIASHAHVQLIYPEGGESFYPGEEVTIEWEVLVPHEFENWDLLYSLDGGATWEELHMNMPLETLSYNWIIPDNPTEAARIKIIQDNEGIDYEDESENFTITEALGIHSLDEMPDFRIYPNPVSSQLNIEFDETEVESCRLQILNILGHIVYADNNISIKAKQGLRINFDGYPEGIYIIRMRTDHHILYQEKIIKMR